MATDPATDARRDERFLVLAPTGRDAPLTRELLAREGIHCEVCRDVHVLCREIDRGAAGILVAEEVLTASAMALLAEALIQQPPWSDIPVVLFTGHGATIPSRMPSAEWLQALGNVTLLDRPVRPITMVSAARAALRARRRQYAMRSELAARETAVRRRDQFLAMLGHELRNPLGAIVMALDTLQPSADEPRQNAIVRRQAHHLSRLVDDLLDVARVTAGKIVLRREALDMADVVDRCIAALRPVAESQGRRLHLGTVERRLAVAGDPVRLEQVLANLVTNGVKYTPPQGCIEVSALREGGDVVVRVRDTGIGIAPDMLGSVFDLFVQAEGTLDRADGGMGIGLTLVRSLVELQGGSVVAESPGLGHGSTFSIRLPFLEDAAVESGARAGDQDEEAASHSVLVIEDNSDSREAFEMLLQSFGHRVTSASDGPSGVRAAISSAPDAVFVDIGLPGLDGYAVARRVRAALGQAVLLVAVTGYGQPEDRRRALEAGFDLHLTKPIDAEAMQRLLRRRDLRRASGPGRAHASDVGRGLDGDSDRSPAIAASGSGGGCGGRFRARAAR